MHVIYVRNVHEALPIGIDALLNFSRQEESRAGPVLVHNLPVTTVYVKPCERVLFWSERDANPFFHLMEALWMLAGRNDVAWLERFNKRMREYSDNGETFHGAYGHRWRNHFPIKHGLFGSNLAVVDQLNRVVQLLKLHPNSRRAVIQMWDCTDDLRQNEIGKDVPCNTQIYLSNRAGILDLTVTCRSNDIIWGAYGANAVHFSILQEYLAAKLGWEVGRFYQISNNYHAYLNVLEKVKPLRIHAPDPYRTSDVNPYDGIVKPYPLVDDLGSFDSELRKFMGERVYMEDAKNSFLTLASCMRDAYLLFRQNRIPGAIGLLRGECPSDWDFAVAGIEWLERRLNSNK
jgi:thymidylate synthase